MVGFPYPLFLGVHATVWTQGVEAGLSTPGLPTCTTVLRKIPRVNPVNQEEHMNNEKNGVNPGNAPVTPTCHNMHHVQVEPAQTTGKTVTERVVERDGGQMVDGETRRWMAKHNLASRTFYAFGYLTSAVRQMAGGHLSADDVARMSAELQELVDIEGVDE